MATIAFSGAGLANGSAASPLTTAASSNSGVCNNNNNNPMATQQFCLKWNNHTTNLVKTFGEMIAGESFTDVILACDGLMIKAHKIVLSACSNYFRELFLATPCKHPIVVLKDMKIEDLRAIIDFMYRGEVNVSQNQLGNLLKTAEVLRVKGLTEVNESDSLKSEVDGSYHLNAAATANGLIDSSLISGKATVQQSNNTITENFNACTPVLSDAMMNMTPSTPVMNQSSTVDDAVSPSGSLQGSRRRKRRRNENVNRNRNSVAKNHHQPQTANSSAQNLATVTASALQLQQQPQQGAQQLLQASHFQSKGCSADLEEEEDLLASQSDGESGERSSEDDSMALNRLRHQQKAEARESIIANSFSSIASTSASSPSHAPSSLQMQIPMSSSSSHLLEQGQSNQVLVQGRGVRRMLSQTSSGQRDILSADNSLADAASNDGSESWSASGNHSMALALRGPVDDDSESDANDSRSFAHMPDGSEGSGRGVDVHAMNQALAYASDQMALQAQSPGGDSSGTGKICVCHLCHLTFTAYSSLRRHMARHFTDRERYECDVCLKSYSRKDYLKEHKKLKHQMPG